MHSLPNQTVFNPTLEQYINLATYRKDGREVRTPVWVAASMGRYYVFSEAKAGKVKRINNNGKMSIAACDMRGNIKSGWMPGSARIVKDDIEIVAMYRAFEKKYGWKMRLLNFFARLSGRFDRRAIISFELTR